MPCESCTHTIQKLPSFASQPVYWCPRCGTIKIIGSVPESESPMIVRRLRDLVQRIEAIEGIIDVGEQASSQPGAGRVEALRMALRAAGECLSPDERMMR